MLTRKGQLQARYLAGLLGSSEPVDRPRRLLASPAARTLQTAQAIADELGLGITSIEDLLPAHTAAVAIEAIERYREDERVVVVGHNPTVTAIVSVLVHGPSAGCCLPGPALKTGHMAIVDISAECPPGEGRLVGLHRYEPALAT